MGLRRCLLGGDLDAVGELHTLDHLWQLIVAVEAAPVFLWGLDELEDHGECGLVPEAALRPGRAVPHGGEGAFDGARRPQVLPVLGGEVVERQERIAVLGQGNRRPSRT